MKVIVTEEHIKNGKRDDAFFCPIALAIKDLGIEDFKKFMVLETDIYLYTAYIKLPPKAQYFIHAFDNNRRSVKPFEFELDYKAS